jgi:3-phosphoshikimate 1-carboxyvinyltransferase
MLAGALAASGAGAVLDGSESLRRRPMERIIDPLSRMGVQIESGGCVPLTIRERTGSSTLQPIHFEQPVASAQVKTCLLLAALAAGGPSTLVEPALSRDHSERMLASMGVELQAGESDGKPCLRVSPLQHALSPLQMEIPGDFSAAAFILVAALIVPGSEVWLRGVGLNPTRTGLLDALQAMGAPVVVRNLRQIAGEPVGDLWVRSGTLHGTQIGGEQVVAMIDEFPIFAVAAAFAYGATEVRQAEELRYKESDRIGSLCRKLSILGVETEEHPDGFVIDGRGELEGGATLNPSSDHRLAMSMAVAGLAARQPVTITGAEIIHESFPGFVDTLEALGANLEKI